MRVSEQNKQFFEGEGVKFDAEKIRCELLPPDVLLEIAKVSTVGARKYKPRNWEKRDALVATTWCSLATFACLVYGGNFRPGD